MTLLGLHGTGALTLVLLESTSSTMCLTIDLGFVSVLHWPCVSNGDHRAAPGTQRLGLKPIAWRLEARDCTRWPRPAQHSPAQPRPDIPSSAQPPPPCGLPAPSPAALFWLQLLGVYVCMLPALSIPSHFPPSLAFSFSDFPLFSYFLSPDLSSNCV